MEFMHFFNPWRAVNTERRRTKALDHARSSLLDCMSSQEYYNAMVQKRIKRLEAEVKRK